MSWDPAVNRQDAIETACHNAIRAILSETEAAHREQRSVDDRLALAAALGAIERERTADHLGPSLPFTIQDCINHLQATAALRRQA